MQTSPESNSNSMGFLSGVLPSRPLTKVPKNIPLLDLAITSSSPSSRADQGCSGLFWYLRVSGSSLLSCDERSGIELTKSPGRDSCLRVTLNERRSLTNNAIGNTPQMRLYRICLQHWSFLRSFLSCHTILPCPLTL